MRLPICLYVLSAISTVAFAANGDIDPTFGNGGLALTGLTDAFPYSAGVVTAPPVVQSDGKILICGTEETGGPSGFDFFVARFTADGQLDNQFSFDGKVTIDFDGGLGGDFCTGIALQDDGKIVVSGNTYVTGSQTGQDFAIARLTSNGTLDQASFNAAGATPGKRIIDFSQDFDQALAVKLQPDQKIVVAGSARTSSNGVNFAVLRLNTDGSPDNSFNLTGKQLLSFNPAADNKNDDVAYDVAIDAAGNIVLSGYSNKGGADREFAVARLQTHGMPDPNFNAIGYTTVAFDLGGANGSHDDFAAAMHIQADGKIVLAGYVDTSTDSALPTGKTHPDMGIARLQADGSPDGSFGIGGKTVVSFDLGGGNLDVALAVTEQTNGKLLVAGAVQTGTLSTSLDAAVVRLDADGNLDPEFGVVGKKIFDFGLSTQYQQLFNGLAFQGTQIIATGYTAVGTSGNAYDYVAVRLQNDLIFASAF